MNLFFERHFAHPIEKVWDALTSSDALAAWLMPNDFQAIIGHCSTFCFGTADQTIQVTVEELAPPQRMVWRWQHCHETEASTVEFFLHSTEGGTVLKLSHSGPERPEMVELLKNGWPHKFDQLDQTLSGIAVENPQNCG